MAGLVAHGRAFSGTNAGAAVPGRKAGGRDAMNGAPRPTTIRQRVALLVGFATVTVIVLFAWLAISGLRSFSQSLRAERRAVAESLAANIDHQVQQTLASLSTAALMAADAPPENLYPSLRAVYLRSLILDGLVVL